MSVVTTNPGDPRLKEGVDETPTSQAPAYLVLSEEERAKGFIRPVRRSYQHVGTRGPEYQLRNLTDLEKKRYDREGFVKFEVYTDSKPQLTGRFWTQIELDNVGKGCGAITTMIQQIAETYARNPHFYGATYCVGCSKHLPVEEFVWLDDKTRVGS